MESGIQDQDGPSSPIEPNTQNHFEEIPPASGDFESNDNSTPAQEEDNERPADSSVKTAENQMDEVESSRVSVKDSIKKFENKNPSTSSLTSPRDVIPKKWEWLPCNYELKREEKGTETYWSLTPIIQLVNPDSKSVPQTDISFELERPFMYNPEVGWNWHKSWNLPNISINLKITDPKTKVPILPPADLKAQLLAVKVLLNRVEQVKLFDLGLKGSNIQDLSDGVCTFSGVKFSSTSYNNEGVKFHLVVLIYIQEDSRNRACPKILYSKISPPIFVDSRKAARNSHIYKNKKINSIYFDSFPPETFTRIFVKRNSKLNESKEEVIENSLGGLCHYFTAPNIRNKVKHPIFLASKFSNCVRLYYNSTLIQQQLEKGEQPTEENLIYIMQKVFFENHVKKNKSEFPNPPNKAFDNKYFILVIEEPNNPDSFVLNKKIADYLEPIINEVLHIIFNSNLLPSHFSLFPTTDLMTSYVGVYPKLVELKSAYGPFEEYDDYEESKATPASRHKSDFSPKDDINVKRERSDSSEYDDSELEEEESEIAKIAEPKKKVKASVGSRKSSRKVLEENIPNGVEKNSREGGLKQTTTRVKEQKKQPAKKAAPQKKTTKTSLDGLSKHGSHISEIKTETEEMNLKSEPDTSSGLYEKNSMISSPDRGTKRQQQEKGLSRAFVHPATNNNIAYQNIPNELFASFGDKAAVLSGGLDLLALQQQQQQRSEQEKNLLLMNMMYPSVRGSQNSHNNALLDMMQNSNSIQNANLAMYQQQILQAQFAAQLQKQEQYRQLQQQFKFAHERNGMELEKDKAYHSELAKLSQGELGMNLPSNLGMGLSQSSLMNMMKNQQYPLMAGFGNRPQTGVIQETISPHNYNGSPMDNNQIMFMNMNKPAKNHGKRNGI